MPTPRLIDGYPAEVFRSEVSGVPTFWSTTDPPFSATLMFRVGRADETLLTSGLTHLVEHLAMPPHARHLFEVNARVEEVRTLFWAHGEPDEVLEFVRSAASELSSLPLDRLESERRILKAEGGGFESTSYSMLLCARFGAQSLGLSDYRECGLFRIGADRVTAWAQEHFTAGNAALWLSGPPPTGFELPLRDGKRTPAHEPPEPVHELPLWVDWGYKGVAFSSIVQRSVAARIGSELIRNRIHHELRYGHGISYDARVDYYPLNADVAHVYFSTDALDTHEEVARDEVLHALEDLGANGPTPEELEHEKRLAERILHDPRQARAWLESLATDELMGAETLSTADFSTAVGQLHAGDISRVAGELLETMALCIPSGLECPSEQFKPLPEWDDRVVRGRRFTSRRSRPWRSPDAAIVVGDEGVSWTDGDGTGTIRFEDAAGLICDGDTPVVLHRLDGRWLNFERVADWPSGKALLAELIAATPSELVVDTGD